MRLKGSLDYKLINRVALDTHPRKHHHCVGYLSFRSGCSEVFYAADVLCWKNTVYL